MVKECLFDKEFVCPVCGLKFKTKKVKSNFIKVIKRETDLRADYEFDNPTYYGINVCPDCGYARFETDFNDINVAGIQIVKDKISSKWKKKSYSEERTVKEAIEVHKLALLNYNITGFKLSTIAKTCLRLSWFYRELGSDLESKFIKHTIESYEQAYVKENLDENPKEELTILYLLGELNRKNGEYKKAMDWFVMGTKSPVINTEKFIGEELRNQMVLAKNQFKKEKAELEAKL